MNCRCKAKRDCEEKSLIQSQVFEITPARKRTHLYKNKKRHAAVLGFPEHFLECFLICSRQKKQNLTIRGFRYKEPCWFRQCFKDTEDLIQGKNTPYYWLYHGPGGMDYVVTRWRGETWGCLFLKLWPPSTPKQSITVTSGPNQRLHTTVPVCSDGCAMSGVTVGTNTECSTECTNTEWIRGPVKGTFPKTWPGCHGHPSHRQNLYYATRCC